MSPDPAPIAFYVHHHGSGHAQRTRIIAERWPTAAAIHVFTSAPQHFADWPADRVHALPMDTDPTRDDQRDHLTGQVLHYAPVNCEGVQQRMRLIADWIAAAKPALFVVDLSVEIALFARLCSVPVALVRLHGFRSDPAHQAAFRLADVLVAPFPDRLEDDHTPDWVREKTIYLGAFSRYDDRTEDRAACRRLLGCREDEQVVVVINGSGGGHNSSRYWSRVARANPNYRWLLVGKLAGQDETPPNLERVGYVDDTFPYLKAADIVIGSGGTNMMLEIAAAGARFLSIPEQRPYSEQYCKMKALQHQGLTRMVSADLKPAEWAKWLFRANDLIPERWHVLRKEKPFAHGLAELVRRIPHRPVVKQLAVSGKGSVATVAGDVLLGG